MRTINIGGTPPRISDKAFEVEVDEEFAWECDDEFDIDFAGESPDKDKPEKQNWKPSGNGKKRVKMKARPKKGRYEYTLTIGGQPVDPAIIIK